MENTIERFADKNAILQVIGCYINNPVLLIDPAKRCSVEDFPERFHKIVYTAIEKLVEQGLEKISPIDIDQFCAQYVVQYKVFTENKGIEYVMKASEVAQAENFEYYHGLIKKFSLLNAIREEGFNVSKIYDPTLTDPKQIEQRQAAFTQMTTDSMLELYEKSLVDLKTKYNQSAGVVRSKGGDNIKELIAGYKEKPEMGLPMISPKMTTMFRGRRLKKFYMESAPQGFGKSRRMAAESCNLAVPYYFDTKKGKWIKHNCSQESVLYISTELELEEVQTVWTAYISGVDEKKILDGRYSAEEEERILLAAQYISEANLYFAQIPDFSVDDIETLIKEYYFSNHVNYVFYDYLSTSMKIMAGISSKTKISNLREDQILLMFSQRLKDLCNLLHIHISTATQLSGDWKNVKEADQSLLRGAKSLSDKPDIASIMMPVRESDQPIIDAYVTKGFELIPNTVFHIYKIRRGSYSGMRLYSYFDKGTARLEDCFVTDRNGVMVDVPDTEVELDSFLDTMETKELPEFSF